MSGPSAAARSPSHGLVLALDAAASLGTIAVVRDGGLAVERVVEMKSNADERFFPAILETLREAGAGPRDIDAVVCGAGPGSFTSLRVVGAIAKGLVVGGALPLYAVPSLALIVAADPTTARVGRWLAALDAMRGDRYVAMVTTADDGSIERVESLGLAPADGIAARAHALDAVALGPDEPRRAMPHARGVVRALALVAAQGPVEVARWEPVYGRLAEAQVKWEAAHGRALVAERYAS